MRRMFAALTVAAFVAALGAPAFAKEATVKGQIVDVSCYNMDKANNAGVDHKMPKGDTRDRANNPGVDHKMPKGDTKDCAIGCAKAGRPMALLTSDGKVYVLTGGLAAEKNAQH